MPLQKEILSYLEELSPESKATGACNIIVKVSAVNGFKLVGQNTEGEVFRLQDSTYSLTLHFNITVLVVRSVLIGGLRTQFKFPTVDIPMLHHIVLRKSTEALS